MSTKTSSRPLMEAFKAAQARALEADEACRRATADHAQGVNDRLPDDRLDALADAMHDAEHQVNAATQAETEAARAAAAPIPARASKKFPVKTWDDALKRAAGRRGDVYTFKACDGLLEVRVQWLGKVPADRRVNLYLEVAGGKELAYGTIRPDTDTAQACGTCKWRIEGEWESMAMTTAKVLEEMTEYAVWLVAAHAEVA